MCILDITESTIPRWMFETGAVFLHGYDKEGNKLCMYILYYYCTKSNFMQFYTLSEMYAALKE